MEKLLRWRRYISWANERILHEAEKLSREQLQRPVVSSFPSLLATLQHMLYWDAVWASRCWRAVAVESRAVAAEQRGRTLDSADNIAALRKTWQETEQDWLELIVAVGQPARLIKYKNNAGETVTQPFFQIVEHVSHHAAYHRGQIITLLRQLGGTAVSTDLLRFDRLGR